MYGSYRQGMTQIKVRIPAQTVTVDVDKWTLEFGVDPKDVREDVRAYFANEIFGLYPYTAGLVTT